LISIVLGTEINAGGGELKITLPNAKTIVNTTVVLTIDRAFLISVSATPLLIMLYNTNTPLNSINKSPRGLALRQPVYWDAVGLLFWPAHVSHWKPSSGRPLFCLFT
jgi:hypothetical protein